MHLPASRKQSLNPCWMPPLCDKHVATYIGSGYGLVADRPRYFSERTCDICWQLWNWKKAWILLMADTWCSWDRSKCSGGELKDLVEPKKGNKLLMLIKCYMQWPGKCLKLCQSTSAKYRQKVDKITHYIPISKYISLY